MSKPFLYLYQFFSVRRKLFYTVLIGLFLITGYFAGKITPEEDISRILPKDPAATKLTEILANSRFADKLVVLVSLKDSTKRNPDLLAAFADSFTNRLNQEYPDFILPDADRFNDSLFPELLQLVYAHLPLFLEPADYRRLDSLGNPDQMKGVLQRDIQVLSSPAGTAMKGYITADPLGIGNAAIRKIRQLQYDENFDLYAGHLLTHDERYLLFFIRSAYPSDNTGMNSRLLNGINQINTSLQSHGFESIQAVNFGGIAVAAGNAAQLRRDSLLTLGLTISFLLIFFIWYFKRKSAPLIIFIPVMMGALFSLSLIYFIQGTISVIALAAGSIVLGIAVNYSLHVYNHFRHRGDMRSVITDLSFPLTIGGLTTIGGFLCLQFVHSEILKDLGLFAAFSLIGASVSSLVVLPQLIHRKERSGKEKLILKETWIEKLALYHPEKNKWLVGLIFLLTLFFSFFVHRVRFDEDMMHINYMSPELKSAEATLNRINEYSLRSVYVVNEGKDLQDALQKQELINRKLDSLNRKNIVRKYSGSFNLLISDSLQKQRIIYWQQYWTPEKIKSWSASLKSSGQSLGFRPEAFDGFLAALQKNYDPLNREELEFLKDGIARDYILQGKGGISLISLLKTEPVDKAAIYSAFSGIPGVTVIDKQYLTAKLLEDVSSDFSRIGWMTSILVFVVLLLTYGRIELTLVSFIPMVIAFVWILGIMGLAGWSFNIVNIILSALIFGLGDDYSLFIMDGLLQEYKTGKKNLSSFKSSIVLSAVTTLAGLGVLIFARHPALKSIALISITGILSVVLIAQVLIPFFFNFLIRNRIRKERFPWTSAGLFKSIFSLSYFAFGSLIVTICGFILVKWNPFTGPRSKHFYHRILSFFTWSVLYIMTNVKKKVINPDQEKFNPPCVMIANHQSFLDILVMTLLHPKVVLLTNHWVWNSPLFGRLVKIAGYYPVALGIENSIGYLEQQVRAGYSIAVFPEGTRSPDNQIKRFHKGAFYIAEKLDLDILPVMIHGTGYTMSKSDFLLKDGYVTIKFLPRIKARDFFFGVDYTERAKYLGRYYRQQFELFSHACEQPRFFREQMIYNYIYKGPVLEWYLRVKIRLEKDYQIFHQLIPEKGRVLDIGCGYGFMSYMLHFTSPARDITGYDYDEEKIAVAEHCFSRGEHIRFLTADITRMQFNAADAIILSDVLHYLDPTEQEELILKCMGCLRPEGILLIREGNSDIAEKHKATEMTEFFSTRFFSFNQTAGHALHFLSGKTILELAEKNQMVCRTEAQSDRTSNQLFIITHSVKAYEKV